MQEVMSSTGREGSKDNDEVVDFSKQKIWNNLLGKWGNEWILDVDGFPQAAKPETLRTMSAYFLFFFF